MLARAVTPASCVERRRGCLARRGRQRSHVSERRERTQEPPDHGL